MHGWTGLRGRGRGRVTTRPRHRQSVHEDLPAVQAIAMSLPGAGRGGRTGSAGPWTVKWDCLQGPATLRTTCGRFRTLKRRSLINTSVPRHYSGVRVCNNTNRYIFQVRVSHRHRHELCTTVLPLSMALSFGPSDRISPDWTGYVVRKNLAKSRQNP